MKSIIFIILFILAYIAFLFFNQRAMIYFPSRATTYVHSSASRMQVVKLNTTDGLQLLAWYWPPAKSGKQVLIVFHGNASKISDYKNIIAAYLAQGYGVLLPEYRGYSGNPGKPTEQGLYADANAAYDFLQTQVIKPDCIILYGESLGSGVAVELASKKPVGALILQAPFTSLAAAAQHHYPWLPVKLLLKDRYDSLQKIKKIHVPLLLIHGENDAIVPVSQGRALLAAANQPKLGVFLPNLGHNNLHSAGIQRHVLEFLAKQPHC